MLFETVRIHLFRNSASGCSNMNFVTRDELPFSFHQVNPSRSSVTIIFFRNRPRCAVLLSTSSAVLTPHVTPHHARNFLGFAPSLFHSHVTYFMHECHDMFVRDSTIMGYCTGNVEQKKTMAGTHRAIHSLIGTRKQIASRKETTMTRAVDRRKLWDNNTIRKSRELRYQN